MTAGREPLERTRARFLLIWVIPIGLAAALSFAAPILNDGDTFWHVATGRWILQHGAVPATDPFSFTFVGRPWVTHEWLTEVVMAAAYLSGGWAGLMLLVGLAMGVTAALMGAWLLRWLGMLPALLAEPFTGVRDLKQILVNERRRDFYRCVSEKMLTYALGRGLEDYDVHTVDILMERLENAGGRPSALI